MGGRLPRSHRAPIAIPYQPSWLWYEEDGTSFRSAEALFDTIQVNNLKALKTLRKMRWIVGKSRLEDDADSLALERVEEVAELAKERFLAENNRLLEINTTLAIMRLER
jgi:hypothetical protein